MQSIRAKIRAAMDRTIEPAVDAILSSKAAYQDGLTAAAKQRQERTDDRIEARQAELWERGRIIVPQGDGNRAGRRAAERRQKREVKAGQAAYRATQEQRRRNRFTAGNMAKAAAGEIGTPALQANVRRVLEREQAMLSDADYH